MKLSEDDDEVRKAVIVHYTDVTESTDMIDKLMGYYSSWHRLKRAVAWMLRLQDGLLLLSKRRRELEAAIRQCDSGSNKVVIDMNKEMQQLRTAFHKGPLDVENLNHAEMEII